MDASRVIGQKDFTSHRARLGRSGLNFDDGSGVAFDASGNLWVGDSGNNRVLEFLDIGGVVSGRAVRVIGQPDFQTNAEATSRDGLWIPVRPGFDADGNLWVPDGNNMRVLEYQAQP
jgi:sugar lactone lactonase YvrE